MNIWVLALIVLVIATTMTMTGRGGGNFYVLALALAGIEMHQAATTGQFISYRVFFYLRPFFSVKQRSPTGNLF